MIIMCDDTYVPCLGILVHNDSFLQPELFMVSGKLWMVT